MNGAARRSSASRLAGKRRASGAANCFRSRLPLCPPPRARRAQPPLALSQQRRERQMNDLHSPSSDQALAGKQMLARDAQSVSSAAFRTRRRLRRSRLLMGTQKQIPPHTSVGPSKESATRPVTDKSFWGGMESPNTVPGR